MSQVHVLIIVGNQQNLKTQPSNKISEQYQYLSAQIILLYLHLVQQHLDWHNFDKHLQIEPKLHQ